MPTYEEYCEEIKSIWETVHLTNMGPKHNKLKEQINDYLKVKNTEFFVNGHLALYCAIKALELKGEIITTPFTFASTTNAIVQAGCELVYCDIKEDYTIDETKIESLITEKTVAILSVHVYGNICNVKEIQRIADKYNLKVIFDSAHAFGVEYEGRGIGVERVKHYYETNGCKGNHHLYNSILKYGTENFKVEIIHLLYQIKYFTLTKIFNAIYTHNFHKILNNYMK